MSTFPTVLVLRATSIICCCYCASISSHWTSAAYPDLRGPSVSNCAVAAEEGTLHYVCDPDRVLNVTEGMLTSLLVRNDY